MNLVEILLLGIVIGAVLGGLGGGGAILTVPALVYVVGQPAQAATTSSLVIVGLTALVGMGSYVRTQRVKYSVGLIFGVVGIPATYAGSYLNHRSDENLLLLGFSALMVVAAVAMVLDRTGRSPSEPDASEPRETHVGEDGPAPRDAAALRVSQRPGTSAAVLEHLDFQADSQKLRVSPVAVVGTALVVGFLTGFFGVGGGFVVVPALVLVLRLPMKWAVGTSLLIVALNSATSLVARAASAHFDWAVIIPFTVAAMAATLAGKAVADRLPARRLKVGFAALLILVAGYTAVQSIHQLNDKSATASIGPTTGLPARGDR